MGLTWNNGAGLFIANSGANNVLLLSANFTTLSVLAGNGQPVPSTGPALSSGLPYPRALVFHPTHASLLVASVTGMFELTLENFIPGR